MLGVSSVRIPHNAVLTCRVIYDGVVHDEGEIADLDALPISVGCWSSSPIEVADPKGKLSKLIARVEAARVQLPEELPQLRPDHVTGLMVVPLMPHDVTAGANSVQSEPVD